MLSDLRFALRTLRRSPGFCVTAVLTLALGIGGTTAIFSSVEVVLLRPLPFHDPDRLVRIWETKPAEGAQRVGVSAANFFDWQARARTFESLALFGDDGTPTVLSTPAGAIQIRSADVTPNFFGVIGVRPIVGPGFSLAGTPRDGPREIVLSHALWRAAFSGDPTVVGRLARIEGREAFTIVGVMPPAFGFPAGTDLWSATSESALRGQARSGRFFSGLGRVQQIVSVAAAGAELASIAEQLAGEHAANSGWTVEVVPLAETIVAGERRSLLVLFAAVACVLFVGCVNVANLLLARGVSRQRAIAVCAAIGASRARIARELLAESVILAVAGGAAGWLVARLALPAFVRLAGGSVPRLAEADLNVTALVFCGTVSMLTTLLAGLVPALRGARADPVSSLHGGGDRAGTSRTEWKLQRALIAVECSLSVALMIGAALLMQSFVRLRSVDPGFDPAQVITMDARVPIFRFSQVSAIRSRYLLQQEVQTILSEVRQVSGVVSAATVSDSPLSGRSIATELTIRPNERRSAAYHQVSGGYFRTLGMPLVEGRDFDERDAIQERQYENIRASRGDGAIVVNQTAARLFWPGGDAIGQYVSTSLDWAVRRRRVVGVVADARHQTLREPPAPEVYVPYLEDPSFAMTLLVRTALPLDRIVPDLRAVLRRVDTELSVANVRMLEDNITDSLSSSRLRATLMGTFAGVGLLLTGLGVYGVLAFAVSRRTREMGIRIALGADASHIRRVVVGGAARAIGVGLLAGLAMAVALTRLLSNLLFGVGTIDPMSFVVSILVVVVATLVACYFPARRAIRTDPAEALRQ